MQSLVIINNNNYNYYYYLLSLIKIKTNTFFLPFYFANRPYTTQQPQQCTSTTFNNAVVRQAPDFLDTLKRKNIVFDIFSFEGI